MRLLLATAALAMLLLPGCAGSAEPVRDIALNIGYTADMQNQYLSPKEVRVKAGETFRLVITNDDKPGAKDSFHDVAFRAPGYNFLIEHEVVPGETKRGAEKIDVVTIDTPGRYKMWCEVGPLGEKNEDGTPKTRHEQMGMWGTIVVE